MCGLVAVINKSSNGFTAELNDVFDTLLFLDQLRGEDSTGAFVVTNKGEVFLAKEATDANIYRSSKEYANLLRRAFADGAALIGHNRKATKGDVTDENAHPFVVEDNIVLVHNGGVFGDHKKHADTEVDSHAIAHVIHEKQGDVGAAMSSIDAAYALMWYDFQKGVLNITRNWHRPLWWMEMHGAYIYSSEKAMLDFVITRMKLTVKEGPKELPTETLQKFTLKTGYNNWPLWDAEHEKLDIKKPSGVAGSAVDPTNCSELRDCSTWGDAFGISDDDDGVLEDVTRKRYPLDREHKTVLQLPPPNVRPQLPTRINTKKLEELQELIDQAADREFMKSRGGGTTQENEIRMFEKMEKLISHQVFSQIYMAAYPFGEKVLAYPFDFSYANQVNKHGGYYLYSHVVNDTDVVVRHFFEERHMDEDRLIKICCDGDYVYEFTTGVRKFLNVSQRTFGVPDNPHDMGGFMIISDKATLMFGGGTGDRKYHPEVLDVKTHQGRTVH